MTDLRVPTVKLTWPAWLDLQAMPWVDDAELGGVLLGHFDQHGIVVEQALANPGGPQQRHETKISFDAFSNLERAPSRTDPRCRRVVGSVHSHTTPGVVRASDRDLQIWASS